MAECLQAAFPDIGFSMPGETVERTPRGIVTEDAWGRYALLTGIGPADASAPAGDQAFSAFEGVERELALAGMEFSHVVRTWLYADRILNWYDDLNNARDRFFRSRGVYGRYVPASTGIGWSGGSAARLVLGAFAAQAKEPGSVAVEALPSPLQCSALEYGSSFSRAAEVRTPGWRRVIVSGTASLAPGSHEVAHVGDVARQIDCAMAAVAAIYASRGMSFRDVSGALVYLKDETCRPHWERWLAAHPEYPAAHARAMVADVCRPDWLFEIESDATQWK
ncbi:MAG: hypothetical protein IKE55_06735 [Kiritimatiellae bacterium]|nr:hypothetical protein [Kiritimatiellia bacterium]